MDIKEFLRFTVPRQVVFFELGYDLACSNKGQEMETLEKSLYGQMLVNTPRAFLHLLNSCIFTIGKRTYVDLFPFFNPSGGSELSILRIIIHFQKFELLTHPLCELFLHLKWLQSRSIYWIMMALNFVFTLMTLAYVLLRYGNTSSIFDLDGCTHPINSSDFNPFKNEPLFCYGEALKIPLLVFSSLIFLVTFAKMLQDRALLCNFYHLRHRADDIVNFAVFASIIADQFDMETPNHLVVAAVMVLGSCRSLLFTISRYEIEFYKLFLCIIYI